MGRRTVLKTRGCPRGGQHDLVAHPFEPAWQLCTKCRQAGQFYELVETHDG